MSGEARGEAWNAVFKMELVVLLLQTRTVSILQGSLGPHS